MAATTNTDSNEEVSPDRLSIEEVEVTFLAVEQVNIVGENIFSIIIFNAVHGRGVKLKVHCIVDNVFNSQVGYKQLS